MRLWSLHPRYFDRQGFFTLWRNALLAQKVLAGEAGKFRNHPQLERFRKCESPLKAIGTYLSFIASEGLRRGYNMSHEKIICPNFDEDVMAVNGNQLAFEVKHLRKKLLDRHQSCVLSDKTAGDPDLNPVFCIRSAK